MLIAKGRKFSSSWLRSGRYNNYNNAFVVAADGAYNNNNVSNTNGLRPALHSPANIRRSSCIRVAILSFELKICVKGLLVLLSLLRERNRPILTATAWTFAV